MTTTSVSEKQSLTSFGAVLTENGVRFQIWAPNHKQVQLVLYEGEQERVVELLPWRGGFFSIELGDVSPGQLYRYKLPDRGLFPDPASRFQPQGVHGPSEVVDLSGFKWTDSNWLSKKRDFRSIYELHIGSYTKEGTFTALAGALPFIASLGVDAIELMPIADFPGDRNWGYDGVYLYAPARRYGRPEHLQQLVNRAHELGLGVFLDVVYNHFGPDGNYIGQFSSDFFSQRHTTDWGDSINLDGPNSDKVRRFFIENGAYWLREFHFDGLRLDATHALKDDSEPHFLKEFSTAVRRKMDRPVSLIVEDNQNLNILIKPEEKGGCGYDGVWADDFHHFTRRILSGDHEGYYRDYTENIQDLVKTINEGWYFRGEKSEFLGQTRGTSPEGIPLPKFVFCIQNHDQVGNRAFGDRLNHNVDLAAYRAASALLLLCPQTVLLFMGQEWAAGSPFLYFTDHNEELGRLVTEGRRREFSGFSAFQDPKKTELIPDPQALSTFEKSRLNLNEAEDQVHAPTLQFYRRLLVVRRELMRDFRDGRFEAQVLNDKALGLIHRLDGTLVVAAIQLKGEGKVDLSRLLDQKATSHLIPAFTSEDAEFTHDPQPMGFQLSNIRFHRPGAVIVRIK